MREIKFRARALTEVDAEDGKPSIRVDDWLYGSLIVDKKEAFIVNGVVESNWEYISLEEWCPVDPETVGQYTGLKDKNGVEIYEGDVVRWRSHPKPTKISEVVWSNQSFGFYLRWFDDDFEREKNSPSQHSLFALNSIEVIGNIYENPELLEAEL